MSKFLYIILLLSNFALCAQTKIDSLKHLIGRQKQDTNKINLLHILLKEYSVENSPQAITYALEQTKLSKKLNFKLCLSYSDLSDQYDKCSNYKQAIFFNQLAQQEAFKLKFPAKEKQLSNLNSAIALIYEKIDNYQGAIVAETSSIKYAQMINDVKSVNISHYNLGNYHSQLRNYNEALEEYKMAENGFILNKDSMYLPYVYNSYGHVFSQKGDFEKALINFEKSYDFALRLIPDDITTLAIAIQNSGEMLGKLGNIDLGITKCLKSAEMFKHIGELDNLYAAYYNIAFLFETKGDLKKSNEYLKLYVHLKDSIFNEDTKHTIHEMSIKYETEKKEQENKILAQDNEKKQLTIYYAAFGILLMTGLVFSVYKSNRAKTQANKLLEEKNRIINQQKQLVESKQTEILDSISYAKRLQEAILPPFTLLSQTFKNIFVYYQPKDIVAGDFYWMEKIGDYTLIAAADCTGHGVPGALVSVVCSNALNRAVHEFFLTDPGQILDKTRELVVKTFAKSDKNVKDGMDISLVSIQRKKDTENVTVKWAGANNPIYILSGHKLTELKGDKLPVGAYINDENHHFTTHNITINDYDKIYIFSDGLPDQFGGPENKKYKSKRMKEKLMESSSLTFEEQKAFMENDLLAWQGSREQVDDILLIGFDCKNA